MSALTGRRPETLGPGSKERKSVLSNLARDLMLVVDHSRAKPELGRQMAHQLGEVWDESCWSAGSTITLRGLNRILFGAEVRLLETRDAGQPELLEAPLSRPAEFARARSKLEAVSRISALTGSPPEVLGPGSKERKSVLVDLARGLGLGVDTSGGKPEIAEGIALALEVAWGPQCWSAGHTITLTGLNQLLLGAERFMARSGRRRGRVFVSAAEEGLALLAALAQLLPPIWDGRDCVAEMREAEYSQWAQDEWAAFYFEYLGLPALINTFGGGPRKHANTRFDYALGHPWDMKVHMADRPIAPLNDQAAMDEALSASAGVGFLVLTGDTTYDDGEFRSWQKEYRRTHGKGSRAERTQPPAYVRKSKARFAPRMVEAFFIPNDAALARALDNGSMRLMQQGRQPSGAVRPAKYSLDLVKSRFQSELLVGQFIV